MSRVLWLICSLFIIYATTIPFRFNTDSAAIGRRLSSISSNPFVARDGRRPSIPDAVQNVMFFVPFGVLGALACRRTFKRSTTVIVLVTVAAAALSVLAESLQLLTVNRVSSASDVLTNTIGGFLGVVVADRVLTWWFGWLREHGHVRWLSSQWAYPALIALAVLVISAWSPFDLTLDVSTVGRKVRALARDPWQVGPVTDEGLAFMLYALAVMTFTPWMRALEFHRYRLAALVGTVILAAGLELSQVFVSSRMPAGSDLVVRLAGAGCGFFLFPLLASHRKIGWWLFLLVCATAVSAGILMLAPFTIADTRRALRWFPFMGYYGNRWFAAVSHLSDVVLLYFPFGFCLGLVRRDRSALVIGTITALAVAFGVEYLQSWIVGRYADVTDIACSGLGGLFGAWFGTRGAEIFARANRSATLREITGR